MDRRGFTLVEMIIALMIFSIILAAVIPMGLNSYKKQYVSHCAKEMLSHLRWAQSMAMTEKKNMRFSITVEKEGYGYKIEDIGETKTESVKIGTFHPSMKVVMNRAEILFTPSGNIALNGHVTLAWGEERKYVYFFQTGRMRISSQENNVE